MKRKIAAVTMAFNEKHKLPRWIRHYTSQVGGADNIYVIDHGSTDGSTSNLGPVNVTTLDRNAGGDSLQSWRADYVSNFCSDLLKDYEYVIYSDADELIIANPRKYNTLYEYVAKSGDSNSAIGFDVLHDIKCEEDLDHRYIFEQRAKMQFVASMCKPVLISKSTKWVKGFHCSSMLPKYNDLYLFHLRYADLNEGFQRLQITRSLDRPEMKGVPVDHQKIDDTTFHNWVSSWLKAPMVLEDIFGEDSSIKQYFSNLEFKINQEGVYTFDYSYRSGKIYIAPSDIKYLV